MRPPGAKKLHDRIYAGDVEAVRALVAAGAPLDKRVRFFTALHAAVMEGAQARDARRGDFFAIAQVLLDGGADVDAPTPAPRTSALQLAMPDEEWTIWLLARGANPDLYDSSEDDPSTLPPVALAVAGGRSQLVARLVAAGARTAIACRTTRGPNMSLLKMAVRFEQPDALAALLEHAPFSPEHLREGLNEAVHKSDHRSIERLLAHGARGDMADDRDRRMPVTVAYTRKDRAAIALLRPFTASEVMAAHDAWVADRRGTLGVFGHSSDEEEQAARAAQQLPAGAIVRGLVDEEAAQPGGLRAKDIIVRIDGRDVTRFLDLKPLLAGRQAGDKVSVTVLRAGEEQTCEVVLRSPSGW